MHRKKEVSIFIVVALFLFAAFPVLAQQGFGEDNEGENNLSERERANNSINNMKKIIQEMNDSDFKTQRLNDTLQDSIAIYEAQKSKEESGQGFSYSTIFDNEEKVKSLRDDAFQARDELFSLKQRLEPLRERDINVSSAESLINEIEKEINDERYEEALEIVPQARKEISEIESSYSQARVVYQATKNKIASFFRENYLPIVIVVGSLILLYILFRKRIRRFFLRRKIRKLRAERRTIENLTKKVQKGYFSKKEIPEEIYNIRAKKYGEMIRNIDRKIPLLQERIANLGGKKKEPVSKGEKDEEK